MAENSGNSTKKLCCCWSACRQLSKNAASVYFFGPFFLQSRVGIGHRVKNLTFELSVIRKCPTFYRPQTQTQMLIIQQRSDQPSSFGTRIAKLFILLDLLHSNWNWIKRWEGKGRQRKNEVRMWKKAQHWDRELKPKLYSVSTECNESLQKRKKKKGEPRVWIKIHFPSHEFVFWRRPFFRRPDSDIAIHATVKLMAPGALYKRERRRNRKHQLFNHLHPPNNSKHEGKNNRVEYYTFANSFPAEKKWDNRIKLD